MQINQKKLLSTLRKNKIFFLLHSVIRVFPAFFVEAIKPRICSSY